MKITKNYDDDYVYYYNKNNSYDLYDAVRKHIVNTNLEGIDLSFLEQVLEQLHKSQQPTTEQILKTHISRLQDDVKLLKREVADAKQEAKLAKNKLRIFLKVIAKFGLVSELKKETKNVIEEEKNYKDFSAFFRNNVNKIEQIEDDISALDNLFDK